MRTTVDVDEHLLTQAKRAGLDAGRSLSKVVEDALRVYLAREQAAPGRPPVRLTTFGGSGLRPGVDLEDKDALAALLGDEDPLAPR